MSADAHSGPSRVASWLDAFPWVEAASDDTSGNDAWWWEPIDRVGTLLRAERTNCLAEIALSRLGRWTLGQIFPLLDGGTPLSKMDLSTRAHNTLARYGGRTVGDIFSWTLDDLLDIRNVGLGTVTSILAAFADAATEHASPTSTSDLVGSKGRHHASTALSDDELVSWGDSFVADLRLIAGWYAALGTPMTALLGADPHPGTPPEIVKARQRLLLISASEVLSPVEADLDAASLLAGCVEALDERAQKILARRSFAKDPATLDELGTDIGITRERVRQIESKARANMVSFLEPDGALELVAAAVREFIGDVLSLDDLLQLVPALARDVAAVGQPAWRVLDRLDDHYEIEDGWCMAPSKVAAKTTTLTRLQELANQHGVVRLSEIGPLSSHWADEEAIQRQWLSYCGYLLDGQYIFLRTQSLGDRVAAVLFVEGTAMAAQTILERIQINRSLGSLKNVLASDDRFERTDRDRWALREWGMDSYLGVRGLIKQEVVKAGGQIDLETLIQDITGHYSVTASSVISYASSAPFEVQDGVVRAAEKDRDARKTPTRTRRLYHRSDGWVYRVQVTKEHLRGSGSVAPIALSTVVGLGQGESRQLPSLLGPQLMSWSGNQPTFGTIRRFLLAADVAIGDEIFLVLRDDGTFDVEVVDIDRSKSDILTLALTLVGADKSEILSEARASLARAIDLPDDASITSIIGAYRDRGDDDISQLLIDSREQLAESSSASVSPNAEINEILDLL